MNYEIGRTGVISFFCNAHKEKISRSLDLQISKEKDSEIF